MKKTMPKDATIVITYKCNARCVMCNIWQKEKKPELALEIYKKLPSSLEEINITGGEPFLRSDLPEIINVINKTCNYPRIIISTNGLLPDILDKSLAKIQCYSKNNIGIGLSLDGIGGKHDKIRGIPGAYSKVLQSLDVVKKNNFKNIRLAFTMSDLNFNELLKVYELSRKLKVDFSWIVAQSSSHYFGINIKLTADNAKKNIKDLIQKQLKSWRPKTLARAYFSNALYEFIFKHKYPWQCQAMNSSFFLDPYGDIYPCNALNQKAGNILSQSFQEIWFSKEADKICEITKKCQKCLMICSARETIKKHWLQVGWWILRHKRYKSQ